MRRPSRLPLDRRLLSYHCVQSHIRKLRAKPPPATPYFHTHAKLSSCNPFLLVLIQMYPGWGCPILLELPSFFGLLSKDRKTSPYFSLSCAFFAENNRGVTLSPACPVPVEHLLRRAPFASWDRLSLAKTLRLFATGEHHYIGVPVHHFMWVLTNSVVGCSLSPTVLNNMHRVLVLAGLLFVLFPAVLRAQSTNASLTGRITDSSKAVIADAKIAAISSNTNVRYEATSNGSGEYYLANLPPSEYRLEVEKSGFKKTVKPDVILHVQDALEINLEMAVGSVNETITVEGGAPLVNTESALVSTVIDRLFVDEIPVNGRSFQTLILLTPGTVVTATAFDDQGQFSVNGQRADGNYFTVDGVSANFGVTGFFPLVQAGGGALPALSASGGTNSLVSVDAMQEFRIQTSSFAPEFGRTPGGQISIVTRSGTNAFHGSLFEYFRNDKLDANDWFGNFNHLPKPAERQNVFGGVFSGPVFKDKTFFFFSYEGVRLRQPVTQTTAVPDDPSRQQAQTSLPAIAPYLNAFPIANGSALGAGLAQFNGSFSNPSSLDAYSIRIDDVIGPKLNLFGRYNYSPSDTDQRGPLPGAAVLSTRQSLSSSVHTLTLGLTQQIKPGIGNEIRANYSNDRVKTKFLMDDFGGAVP